MFGFFLNKLSFIIESLKTYIHLYYGFKEAKQIRSNLGALGSQWDINKTMAQIHALMVSAEPFRWKTMEELFHASLA
jgi:hypothetical protein